MGILGIIIQTEFGLPLYMEMFDPKLEKFQQMDSTLTAGFMTALNMFAKQYDVDLGYIKILKENDIYGTNLIATKIGEYLILCFVEPYLYNEVVKEKIGWIYEHVLQNYEPQIKAGKIPHLTNEEKVYISDTLQDVYLKSLVASKKEEIDQALGKFFLNHMGIYGVSINSFDNSILYYSGISEDSFKLYFNNMGRRSSVINDFEIIDSYISIPEYQPARVYVTNPGIKFQIQTNITNLPEKMASLYYYIIGDPHLDIQQIIKHLTVLLNPFLSLNTVESVPKMQKEEGKIVLTTLLNKIKSSPKVEGENGKKVEKEEGKK